jgi:hypothetical protein
MTDVALRWGCPHRVNRVCLAASAVCPVSGQFRKYGFDLDEGVLFQGSVGRTDFPYGSHETLMKSIKEKVLPLGDDVVFLPGHGPASQIGAERKTNPFIQGL